MKAVHYFLMAALWLSINSLALASNITVNPIQLSVTPDEPTAVLTVTNNSDEQITVQADVLRWRQQDGEDSTLDTNDMVISPPLFQLQANESQLVRIAWLSPHPLTAQGTYRVMIRQIATPSSSKRLAASKLNLVLSFSVPLFIDPATPNNNYRWRAKWTNKHELSLAFENLGNMTQFINQIECITDYPVAADVHTFAYIMPKQRHIWTLNTKLKRCTNVKAMINGEWKINNVEYSL